MSNERSLVKVSNQLVLSSDAKYSALSKLLNGLSTTEPFLIPYRKGDKWGYCDKSKNILIDCKYDDAHPFSEGLARVELNDKVGFINVKDELTVPFIYDDAEYFEDGLARVMAEVEQYSHTFQLQGYVNREGSEIVSDIGWTGQYSEGLIYDFKRGGYVDERGNLRIEIDTKKTGLSHFGKFSDGYASVLKDGKFGFINRNGIITIPCQYFVGLYRVSDFKEGYSAILIHDENDPDATFYINKSGIKECNKIFRRGSSFSEGLAYVEDYYSLETEEDSSIGRLAFGFIDKKGTTIIPNKYEMVREFSEGLAAVEFNNRWGYIDSKGSIVVPCKYDWCEPTKQGLSQVTYGEKYGFIDRLGEEVIPIIYHNSFRQNMFNKYRSQFRGGLARVELNDREGYIDKNGTQYWED